MAPNHPVHHSDLSSSGLPSLTRTIICELIIPIGVQVITRNSTPTIIVTNKAITFPPKNFVFLLKSITVYSMRQWLVCHYI